MKKLLTLLFLLIFLSSCSQATLIQKAQTHLGTIVEIKVADQDKPRQVVNNAINLAFAEIERLENLLSRFKPDSDIARINASASRQPIKVSSETISLLEKSMYFSQLTEGAYDITVGPLVKVWQLKETANIPKASQIQQALGLVGYENIDIAAREQSVFLPHPDMSLDLGGIAKGYAVDRAIEVLKQQGIKNALVDAGGDIYLLGDRDRAGKWRVAVQHPRKKNAILTVLELENKAVATSGDYQRYTNIEGRRYSHIINPKTGYPCQDIPASVTVLASDCLTADALATSIFVLGPQAGIDLVNQLPDTEAIVTSAEEGRLNISVSQGLAGKLKFKL